MGVDRTYLSKEEEKMMLNVLMSEGAGPEDDSYFNTDNVFFYLSDLDTYELYFINQPKYVQFQDYHGKKCYEVIQGRDTPCPFCTSRLLKADQYYVWEHFNPVLKSRFILQDKLTQWRGKTVRMEIATEVGDEDALKDAFINSLQNQSMLIDCIQQFVGEENPLQRLSEVIGRYFKAERAYVYLFDLDKFKNEQIFAWQSAGQVYPYLRHPDQAQHALWSEMFVPGKQIIVRNSGALGPGHKAFSDMLQSYRLDAFCFMPLFADNLLLGYLVLDNFTAHLRDLYLLTTLATHITSYWQRRAVEENQSRLLYQDSVTGYQSYGEFLIKAHSLLSNRGDKRYSLWYGDLRNFKYINDVYGYDVGNSILKYWADLLNEDLGEDEAFARVTSDHFAALYRSTSLDELQSRFDKISSGLSAFGESCRRKIRLDLVGGVYIGEETGPGLNLAEMLNRANMAQKTAKTKSGSALSVYTEEMRRDTLREMSMETQMRTALANGSFLLYLQPQQPLQGKSPVVRAEALVRWKKADQALILPGEFIPLFERNGFIVELDRYVFELVCRYLKENQPSFSGGLRVAVNVSRRSLLQPDFVQVYSGIKEQYGLADGSLELEFTESIAVEDTERFRALVIELQKAGFVCSMDDFGTGQSSLNVLKSLPLDVLKLDRQFFLAADEPRRGTAVIRCVLMLARELGMESIAEGIEEPQQVERLRLMGCDYIQGFVFSRPIPAQDFKAFADRYLSSGNKKQG